MKMKDKNFISLVIYVHNNKDEIEGFLTNVYQIFNENFETFEIICVDDFSTDSSTKMITDLGKKLHGTIVNIVHMSFYQGIELSMNAGVDLAIGDFIFEFDTVIADYPVETITNVYMHALKGYDIVSAIPQKARHNSSRMFYNLFNRNSKQSNPLRTESFRVLSRRALNRVRSMSYSIPYRKALYANCGLKMDVIAYESNNRVAFTIDKQESQVRHENAINAFILFTDVAYKIASIMTIVMMCIAVFTGIYAVVIFSSKQPVVGWTTTMLFLSVGFFGVFAVLAFIIKYVSFTLDLLFKKQRYTIESVEKLTE